MKVNWEKLLTWLLLPAFCVVFYVVGSHPWLLPLVAVWLLIELVLYLTLGKMFGWTIGIIVETFRKDRLRTEEQPEETMPLIYWLLPVLAFLTGYAQHVVQTGNWLW